MTRVALRGIRAHLGRFLLSVLAVLLGVAFVAGTFSLRTMMNATFADIIESGAQGDAYLRGSTDTIRANEVGRVEEGANRVPLDLAEEAAAADGVEAAVPDITGPIVLVGADGTAVAGSGGAPSFGIALYAEDPSVEVVDGRAPSAPGEIALETSALRAADLAVGDTTTVVLAGAVAEVEVVGEVGFGAAVAGAVLVFLDVATATAAFSADGQVDQISIYGEEGVAERDVVAAVSAAVQLPDDAEVVPGEQIREEGKEQVDTILGFISTFLLVFAAISLFVGAFIIANTFQMLIRQRQREFAMLRAIGASPQQVFASILVQAAVVGVLGAVAGVAAGVGLVAVLRQVLAGMGMELSGRIPLDGFTIGVSVATGVVVSILAAAVPARRAALTPPVQAMRDDVVTHDRASLLRAALGVVLLVGGVTAVLAATSGRVDPPGTALGAGAAAVVLAVLVLAPTVVPAALSVLAAPVVAALRPLGGLARGNVTRNPKRTASTAGALMIGMALVGAAAVIAASTQASTRSIVDNESLSDFLLQSATQAVPAELAAEVGEVEGVERADALVYSAVTVGDDVLPVLGVPADMFGATLQVEVLDGDLASLADGDLAVQEDHAEEQGWAVGDTVTLTSRVDQAEVRVGAIIDSDALGVPVVLPSPLFDDLVAPTDQMVSTVFVLAEDGVDVETVRAGLVDAAQPYVVVSVLDNEEFANQLAEQVNRILVILYALLGLSIVIAVLGIVNTLALSIAERTREIGLLRAVGLGRLQLASVITIESVMTAVFGTVLGILVGVGLGATLPMVYEDQGLSELVIPWTQLGVFLALAVVVGAIAALWPAIRAARMDVLDAVSYE